MEIHNTSTMSQSVVITLVGRHVASTDVLDMLGEAQSEENSLAQSSQDLRVDSGNVDETKVSLVFCQRKHQEH
ncbi:hypothetical protein TNCV_3794961 [Trichonephila clavipes]|nr:hypothetical protein TNCV_3794961 [Trichonephila clavipes]